MEGGRWRMGRGGPVLGWKESDWVLLLWSSGLLYVSLVPDRAYICSPVAEQRLLLLLLDLVA